MNYPDAIISYQMITNHLVYLERFNVCIFPRPLNYFDVEKGEGAEGKWIQLSSSILKDEVNEFIQAQDWSNEGMPGKELLTKEFLTRPKDCKLVLFSMGTMVSSNRKVMDMLIAALAGCRKHKFIVSKGKDGDDWKLPANCVGANSLNQLELLKSGHLDAFISHMGNNSFTGSFNLLKTGLGSRTSVSDDHSSKCTLSFLRTLLSHRGLLLWRSVDRNSRYGRPAR